MRFTVGTFFRKYLWLILTVSVGTSVFMSLIIVGSRLQDQYLKKLKKTESSNPLGLDYIHPTIASVSSTFPTVTGADVLGVSYTDDIPDTIAYPTLFILPTEQPTSVPTPYPTSLPIITSAPLRCDGTATEEHSQVYISQKTVQVGTESTITVELRDCKNSLASDDTLSITLQGSNNTARINGQLFPINIKATNGKATFTVSSQTAGTDTYLISDTNQHFAVTMPGYHNPAVTFTSNSSGNANCTTAAGIPNAWYSDVYPNPPISTSTGSVDLSLILRDCNKNQSGVSDSISISLLSGDSSTKVNGSSLPVQITTQNGAATFSVSSAGAGTVTLRVENVTRSFIITNVNNNNPSISFTGTTAQMTPTPTIAPTQPSPTPTLATPSPTSTISPEVSQTPTPNPQ